MFLIFVFTLSIFSYTSIVSATEATYSGPTYSGSGTTNSSLYSNPNQNNNNAYKFKISDVVNSSLLTSVVGCTGIVNKVSTWMLKFVQSPAQQAKIMDDKITAIREQLRQACTSVKASSEAAGDSIPTIGGLSKSIDTIFAKIKVKIKGKDSVKACQDEVNSTSPEALKEAVKANELEMEQNTKTNCLDGIAITLAKNQLTAMTRSAMNWVNSGYGGNPFFVQNMQNLTYNLEKNVIETGIDIMLSPDQANPYAADFARSTINSQGLVNSSSRFLGGLQSDLSNFITSPESYYSNEQLDKADMTQTALQNARNANDAFARDFSLGGWDAWLALTQREGNNPLGFNMTASQYFSDMQSQVVSDTRAEVAQNNGFMSQKECLKWQMYNADSSPKTENVGDVNKTDPNNPLKNSADLVQYKLAQPTKFVFVDRKPLYQNFDGDNEYGVCVDWKVVTPGSLIKEKVTGYLNSPERQLELAKTINDSLNALFSVLISKLQSGGLSSLSDSAVNTNWTDNMNTLSGDSSGNAYDNNGAYDNFNLTRDLGNTYIHDTTYPFGEWNAEDNITTSVNGENDNKKLYPNLNPELHINDSEGNSIISNRAYYTVNMPGQTKLMNEGYNYWQVGDRAFWDGTKWQNWKCGPVDKDGQCTNQKSPIKRRGVIQIQNDYIVAAKEILKILPNVMPKLGELDYCLPGPNPSYKTNSADAQAAYQDWYGSAYVGAIDTTNERFGVRIDKPGDRTYDNLQAIYKDNPNVWKTILGTINGDTYTGLQKWIHDFSVICDRGESGSDCTSSYFYSKKGNMNKYQAQHFADKTDLKEITLNYVNNKQFQNFYNVFDKIMDDLYFKNVTKKYNEKENSSELTPNPAYIPIAEEGYDFTKGITYYSDENIKLTQEYTDAITQAKINIAKLEPIKKEVSGIIQAAQDRRKLALDKLINEPNNLPKLACEAVQNDCLEGYASGQPVPKNGNTHDICQKEYDKCIAEKTKSGEILSEKQLQDSYQKCLAEENIEFYDAEGIMAMGSPDSERCNDGIDNDLNGLIDSKDPACPNTATTNFKCLAVNSFSVNSYFSDGDCGDGKCFGGLKNTRYTNTPCEMRKDQKTCAATNYTYGASSYTQNWFDPYRTYKVKSCAWADVVPVKGQCTKVLGSDREVHSYFSNLNCNTDKCRGQLALANYSPSSCEVRGPNDCTSTESISSGPVKVKSGFLGLDPYNKYIVNKCAWNN